MAKLSKEEEDQLAALRAKAEAPDEPADDDDDQDDDGNVFVLTGKRADTFLSSIMGTPKAKKTAPGKAPAGEPANDEPPADEPPADEPPPKRAPRYFR